MVPWNGAAKSNEHAATAKQAISTVAVVSQKELVWQLDRTGTSYLLFQLIIKSRLTHITLSHWLHSGHSRVILVQLTEKVPFSVSAVWRLCIPKGDTPPPPLSSLRRSKNGCGTWWGLVYRNTLLSIRSDAVVTCNWCTDTGKASICEMLKILGSELTSGGIPVSGEMWKSVCITVVSRTKLNLVLVRWKDHAHLCNLAAARWGIPFLGPRMAQTQVGVEPFHSNKSESVVDIWWFKCIVWT